MSDQHIVSAFDRDLEGIQAHVMKMGGLVEAAIVDASQSLLNQDEELSAEVIKRDQAIDDLDTLINEECANLIALRAPAAVDLRVVLSVMKIAGNLERIGDYAKNMAKRNAVLVHMTPIEGARGALQRMAREVQLMLKDVLDAFIERDLDKAQDVLERDRDVDQMYNALFREFLTFMMEDPRHITPCMHLHFIAKNTERMGDHVTSIAEQVIYLVSGSLPEENRPKATRYEAE
ncbi:PhoU-like phosphate uptake regulator [Shimia isoporae]|uniref:Phosphate-specific transport system accessory protein PhoU n=1 Tax=Shimia isoporae TaxID=647720 RepID=A0A4R1NM20_9RHOB|nr:phosphate signaling complex protein PhoU [Shimia isoporae]TCL09446.1 PhoU-like phosphate uptake regulator [Shimia isoporae]